MVLRVTKYRKSILEKVDKTHLYPLKEALDLLKSVTRNTFNESVDVAVALGVDPRKSDQMVRGAAVLPHGLGKAIKVIVFAQGEQADLANKAGADRVGFEDLIGEVQKGFSDFDVVIATPDAMRSVSKLGPVLGPRGLMPNPKVGTVAVNVEKAVKEAKSGQVRYKTDKAGLIHASFGKASFTTEELANNLKSLIKAVVKSKPASAKGIYLKKIVVSTTMGLGVPVDLTTVEAN